MGIKRKILVVELWGLGDLTFATTLIEAARDKEEVHLVGKAHARMLLQPTYPELNFISYDAPWTAQYGKYQLWKWRWSELITLIFRLRREKYDLAVSIRNDPRDHFFMWLIGARERISFVIEGAKRWFDTGWMFLTTRLKRTKHKQHKVEDWRQIACKIGLSNSPLNPKITASRYRSERISRIFQEIEKPVICLHTGARIAVRRWPEEYFLSTVDMLRTHLDFHLIVIPEPKTRPSAFFRVADTVLTEITIRELVDVIGRVDLLLCNDSGPSHIAASCGRPTIPIFGPSDPEWFHPWGSDNKMIIRDICPWRPCFDYCRFSESHCLTKLLPEIVMPEIVEHILSLIHRGIITDRLLKTGATRTFEHAT